MNTPPQKEDYLLLFRDTAWDKDLSPTQVQQVLTDWYAWLDRLMQEGKCTSANPLLNQGKIVSGKHGASVVDGPFAESKEAIGGYFYLQVADEAEAVQIAQQCPALPHGCVVEVRPISPRCSMSLRATPSVETND